MEVAVGVPSEAASGELISARATAAVVDRVAPGAGSNVEDLLEVLANEGDAFAGVGPVRVRYSSASRVSDERADLLAQRWGCYRGAT